MRSFVNAPRGRSPRSPSVCPRRRMRRPRWTFCVAAAEDGAEVWISDVFAAEASRERLEGAFRAAVERLGAAKANAQCPQPRDDRTDRGQRPVRRRGVQPQDGRDPARRAGERIPGGPPGRAAIRTKRGHSGPSRRCRTISRSGRTRAAPAIGSRVTRKRARSQARDCPTIRSDRPRPGRPTAPRAAIARRAGPALMPHRRIDNPVEPARPRGVGDGVAGRIAGRRIGIEARMRPAPLRSTNSPAMLANSSA